MTTKPFILLLGACFVGCSPPNGRWQQLAQFTNSSGSRCVIAQQHYDWVEGWQVVFAYADASGLNYGYYLDNESDRWRDVRLEHDDELIKVFKKGQQAALFDILLGTFQNRIQGHVYSREDGIAGGTNAFIREILKQ